MKGYKAYLISTIVDENGNSFKYIAAIKLI